MAMNDSVGIMHPAYFVGRAELLDWLNSTLQLRLSKIEETASGAVACQIFDVLFPGTVQMARVNWGARSEWEFVNNYKVLQSACDKVGCDKKIDVDRLIKAKQQDNLEFMQWLKKFYEDNVNSAGAESYDAPARRALGKGASSVKWCKGSSAASATGAVTSAISPTKPPVTRPVRAAPSTSPGKAPSPPSARAGAEKPVAAGLARAVASGASAPAPKEKENIEHVAVVSALKAEIESSRKQLDAFREESNSQLARMELQMKQSQEDRDYYLQKLKNVEVALQSLTDEQQQDGRMVISTIKHVLYDSQEGEEPVEAFGI